MNTFLTILCSLLWLAPLSALGATTYYASPTGVIGNDGSEGSPKNLQAALNLLAPGVTVIVMDGFYQDASFFVYQTPGAAGNPAIVLAQNKWKAILRGTNSYALGIQESSYVVVDGLCLSNAAINGVQIQDSTFVTIQNCWVVRNLNHGIITAGEASTNLIIRSNLIERNGVDTTFDHGIYIDGANQQIYNNVVRYNAAYGIQYFTGWTYPRMNNTRIFQNLTYGNTNQTGVVMWNSQDDGALPGTNYLYGNTILDGVQTRYGRIYATNNIILDPSGHYMNVNPSAVLISDYNLAPVTLASNGTHDVVADPSFVNTNNGLYWLRSDSPARGAAKTTIFAPTNFFGVAQSSVSDIGAFQFSAPLAGDWRTLDPIQSISEQYNYWFLLTGALAQTGPGAVGRTAGPVGLGFGF